MSVFSLYYNCERYSTLILKRDGKKCIQNVYKVTGATGFLGRAVVGLLLTKVTDIYATVDNDITVILNGRTLSGAVNNMFDVRENAALTLLNGIIVCESDCCVCASGAQKVKFERCNVKTSGGLVCSSDSEIMFDNCTVSGNALSDKLVRLFSGAKLVFRNEIEFMGQIEREDDILLEFPNVKGKFAFDPNDYSDSCDVVKNNDGTWSVN